MEQVNKIYLRGRLTRDPVLRYTSKGVAVTDLGLAVNYEESRKETLFIDVTVWKKRALLCCKYLKMGSKVRIEGRLRMDSWVGKDGEKKRRYHVVAERVGDLYKQSSVGGGGEKVNVVSEGRLKQS